MTEVYVDTETSGLSPWSAVVLEIAGVATDGDSIIDTFSEICNPGEGALMHPGLDDALRVNGLTREEIAAARPIADVAFDFREWLSRFGESSLHAYNNAFDAGFLTREPWNLNPLSWGACVMRAVSGGRKWLKLSAAAQTYSLEWEGDAHRALADAKMAHRVHRAWLKRQGLVRV